MAEKAILDFKEMTSWCACLAHHSFRILSCIRKPNLLNFSFFLKWIDMEDRNAMNELVNEVQEICSNLDENEWNEK